MKKDYYAILGVKPSATEKEIRSAYKKLARKHHPDVNPGNKQAEEKFKEITEAYEVLTDPDRRKAWERGGEGFDPFGGRRPGGPAGTADFDAADFGSILNDLFSGMGGVGGGAGRRGAAPRPGADLQFQTTLTFEQALAGTMLRIPLARTETCGRCGGEGTLRASGACPRCHGSGRIARGGASLRMTVTCPQCGGTGEAPGEACPVCGGAGAKRVTETIQVRIPPGVEDGGRVKVAGKGEAGTRGGPTGDLYVVLKVAPHRWFRREGKDVVMDLPLSFSEAALGTRLEVPTLDGRVTVTVPAGSRGGQRLRLKGKGAGARGGHPPGDQILILQIVPPRMVDPESRKLLEELERLNPTNPRADLGW